ELQEPPWAGPQHGPALLPAMLAGTWKHTSAGDREALARLGGLPYEGINAALARWANEPDPPVRRVGDVWYLVSREDAWRLLARYVDGDVLSRCGTWRTSSARARDFRPISVAASLAASALWGRAPKPPRWEGGRAWRR